MDDENNKIAENSAKDAVYLWPRAIFGINGGVVTGLFFHPDKKHLIFPLGNKIGVAEIGSNRQDFISGHNNDISCLDVSASGNYLASGQINHMGFRAYVILWDYHQRKELARHDLHRVRVQDCCFSAFDKYVFSIGGVDDDTVIVFDIETHTPICRCVSSKSISGHALCMQALHTDPNFFIVCGDRHLRIWSVNREMKKLNVQDVNLGKHQRIFTSIHINYNDEHVFLGTMTGDIVKAVINCCDINNVTKAGYTSSMLGAYGVHNPRKPYGKDCNRYVNGVRAVHILAENLLLIGAGDGTIELVEERRDISNASLKDYPSPTWPKFKGINSTKVNGAITSIVEITKVEYYVATDKNEIYSLNIKTFGLKLLKTCHKEAVNQIVFPKGLSSVFATAGFESIRLWSVLRLQELLRIMVYNFQCANMAFVNDGTSILSAWNDGVIRAFTPITGRLIFAIPNAHNKGCSALCVSSNGRMLVTGGIEGQVRVWNIEPFRQTLLGVLKDHSGPISSLDFNNIDSEVVSASSDGSCVIWDVKRLCRKQVITANTQFMAARYFPTGVQMLTCGSDGRISYWMVFNGSLIRELEGSKKLSINCVAINATGEYFISVGADQWVKVWEYNSGIPVCKSQEHASAVVSGTYSPCGKFFVTGSTDGSVMIWDLPEKFWGNPNRPDIFSPLASPTTSKTGLEPAQAPSSAHRLKKEENIKTLPKKASKDDVTCVECPKIPELRKQPEVNESCGYVPTVSKC